MDNNNIHNFTFNGTNSLEYGVFITDKNSYNRPERDISFISVPGRNGDLIIDNGRYKNVNIKYGLRMVVPHIYWPYENISPAIDTVVNWLSPTTNYYKLTDSYNPDYYRYACITSALTFNQKHSDIVDFSVTMSAKPYKYRHDGNTATTITSTTTLYNNENAAALPLIRLYSSDEYNQKTESQKQTTSVSFVINGTVFPVYNVNTYVDIDSELMSVYKSNTNMNKYYTITNFPVLGQGASTVGLVSNAKKIEIIPRWRAL